MKGIRRMVLAFTTQRRCRRVAKILSAFVIGLLVLAGFANFEIEKAATLGEGGDEKDNFKHDPSILNLKQRLIHRLGLKNSESESSLEGLQSLKGAWQRKLILEQDRPPDSEYNFNVTASDILALDRSIPDTRPPGCKNREHPVHANLSISVVIPFFNEAMSILMRTVHSILHRTPRGDLLEVILVDDASTYEYLQSQDFSDYWQLWSKVTLVRNNRREGLIRSRLRGADLAKGAVLVFMDAHVECNVGWLDPLLAELENNPQSIVQPFVDGMDAVTLEYSAPVELTKSAFTWDLRYVWMELPAHQQARILSDSAPFPAATLVGCVFAVRSAHFFHLGGLDPGLNVWGGENLELAFRAWMCGGSVLTVPCSRVGHIFKDIPYPLDVSIDNNWLRNLARVAEVWMDDYKRLFHAAIGVYDPLWTNLGVAWDHSIQDRHFIRDSLQCKGFEWYLDNVIPEMPLPPWNAAYHGEIINKRTEACWEIMPDGHVTINYRCFQHKIIISNFFTLTVEGLLLYKDKCVKFLFPTPSLRISVCPSNPEDLKTFGVWSMQSRDGERRWGQLVVTLTFPNEVKTWCVEQLTSAVEPHKNTQMVQTAPACEDSNEFQQWAFTYRLKYNGESSRTN